MVDSNKWTKYLPELLEQQNHCCFYCGQVIKIVQDQPKNNYKEYTFPDNMATTDHIIPISTGGEKYNILNLIAACHHCNSIKSNTSATTFINLLKLNDTEFNKLIQKKLKCTTSGTKKIAYFIKLKSIRKRRMKNMHQNGTT
ncbi:MAG: HNH endonuclease [Richelia sp. RM2_1_2]|nr:HNH endonuclease [Richelia sp. RM2_1_2]